MLRNIAQFKDTIEGKDFQLICDNDSPLPIVKEFLFRCLKYVGQIEDTVKAQQEKAAQEKADLEKKEEANQENKVT